MKEQQQQRVKDKRQAPKKADAARKRVSHWQRMAILRAR